MAKPQHRTREHREARARLGFIVARGEAWCVEVVCLEELDGYTRWIEPGSAWDVCHDPNGTVITGPGHSRCNRSEGASRGNSMRGPIQRWAI